MKHSVCLIYSVALMGLLSLIFTPNAQAYIDPGTGSYILQLIIAGLLGVSYAVKIYWRNIKAYISNIFSKMCIVSRNYSILYLLRWS